MTEMLCKIKVREKQSIFLALTIPTQEETPELDGHCLSRTVGDLDKFSL